MSIEVYELRVDGGECYYSLGIFACVGDIKKACAALDGVYGGPLHEYGDDGERLEVYIRELGDIQADCSSPGVLLCYADRDWYVNEETDEQEWRTEWKDKYAQYQMSAAEREHQEEIKRREEACRSMGREPGPFGCLCQDMYHYAAGDGCCVCGPDAS